MFNGANIRMFMYLYGSALFLWRDRVPMGAGILVALLAALVVASFDRSVSDRLPARDGAVRPPPRLCAGRTHPPVQRGRRHSYGVYIYAFPIQQTLALLFPAMTLAAMMARRPRSRSRSPIVSWKLIEERALGHKNDCAAATKRLFNFGLARIGMAER